ncbi:hypothetical protein APHAL10511_007764 [Amanita phalloides]|nr:hypothetical protein APHAL10511_007764 [Amanita phalloides]
MDSLQSYELGHSDALCPIQHEADKSFMGEHQLLQPLSRAEFHSLTSALISTIQLVVAQAIHVAPGTTPSQLEQWVTSTTHLPVTVTSTSEPPTTTTTATATTTTAATTG